MYALATRYGIDTGVVAEHLKERGVSLRPTLLQPGIDRVLGLHADGLKPTKIGRLLGRDLKTMSALLRRRGLLG